MAAPNTGQKVRSSASKGARAAGCKAATGQADLDINNVRARVMNGGDAWWDLVSTPRYEVPKVTEAGQVRRNVMFAGALWIGGLENNNLRLAAMTYRQSGSDFFPGPLNTTTAATDQATCVAWDKIYEMTREEIDNFLKNPLTITDAIRNWPAHNAEGGTARGTHDFYQAPFVDVDGNGEYNPEGGDYPDIHGDQALWYVYNDKGNAHGESQADPIGLELNTQAFAYATNDEINDMTFYTTTVINRSSSTLDSTYFGQWCDPDLGYAFDDYVGVDVPRSMGYCYNGDDNDEGVFGYGANPPTVGVDFFEGPIGRDGKEIGLEYFVYYNNDWSTTGNPSSPIHYYYYLTGRWKNGSSITYGGNGFGGTTPAKAMFDGDPTLGKAGGWTELTAGNRPADRRFLQSSGPFQLRPGARNRVTIGVIYARASSGGAIGSLNLLKLADDKAQKLYNNNFKLIDGPNAPDMTIRELNNELIISLENTHDPKVEQFKDTIIGSNGQRVLYKFQGYQIFQLKNSSVSAAELQQPDKARIIAQVDLEDQYTDIVNQEFDPIVNQNKGIKYVEGAENKGIRHTFRVRDDQFASGSAGLVNYKFYYYMVVAYAVAEDPSEPIQYLAGRRNIRVHTGVPHPTDAQFGGTILNSFYNDGPEITRIEGIGNGRQVLDLTRESEMEILKNGSMAKPVYARGSGPVAVRVYDPTRVKKGRFSLRFIDTVQSGKPTIPNMTVLSLDPAAPLIAPSYLPTTRWELTDLETNEKIMAEAFITNKNEQLLFKTERRGSTTVRIPMGLSITVEQVLPPGQPTRDESNGFLEVTKTYAEVSKMWLGGVEDIDHVNSLPEKTPTPGNWIRSGRYGKLDAIDMAVDDATIDEGTSGQGSKRTFLDPNEVYESALGRTIAPAALVARSVPGANNSLSLGPVPNLPYASTRIALTPNIDLVFTPDKSKWSECIVVEIGESPSFNEGGVNKFDLRAHDGWMGDVDDNGNPVYSTDPNKRGKSMFPGYAINVETGERLNVFFAEDSRQVNDNGRDMIWNPTSKAVNEDKSFTDYMGRYIWGGKHYIYVMNSQNPYLSGNIGATAYDKCEKLYAAFRPGSPSSNTTKLNLWSSLGWVMEPMLNPGYRLASLKDGIIPTETRIRCRVSKPYATFAAGTGDNKGMPLYEFNTENIAAETNNTTRGKSALDIVNVVPNPYYATSSYETNQLDNRVRITNLPTKCEVKIYTVDGTLVRKFNKDESANTALASNGRYPTTFLDWDLRNQKGVPIVSGVYIIHVDAGALGQTVVKWFGVMRPIDLDTF